MQDLWPRVLLAKLVYFPEQGWSTLSLALHIQANLREDAVFFGTKEKDVCTDTLKSKIKLVCVGCCLQGWSLASLRLRNSHACAYYVWASRLSELMRRPQERR